MPGKPIIGCANALLNLDPFQLGVTTRCFGADMAICSNYRRSLHFFSYE